jgi:hypothetical protein
LTTPSSLRDATPPRRGIFNEQTPRPLRLCVRPFFFMILMFLPVIFFDTGKAYAVDITAGITSWYAWGEQYNSQEDDLDNYSSTIESDPSLLYGPALSVKFNDDFNLTFVFLYGTFDSGNSSFKRIDSDLAINYKLHDYFKIFAGLKYLSYGVMPVKSNLWGDLSFKVKDVDPHTSYGTGLGVSATIPIIGNLFGLATVSGLYLFGKQGVGITDPYDDNPENLKIGYNEYGINTNLSAAYYIAEWSTVISLGGRFQYIIADYKDNAINLSTVRFMIYGVTLTATYTFNI